VLEAGQSAVKRRVTEVALKRKVDAVLLEMPQQRLSAVEDTRALPALGDAVDVVVVAFWVQLRQQ